MSGFLDELSWRGLLHQTTSETLPAYLATPGRVGYAGFDPTADSLTIGNYIPMKVLAHWQRCGHKPIVLMGGGTGLIGDPSGKSAERMLMSEEQVRHNVERQRASFAKVLNFDKGPTGAVLLDNAEWLTKLGYLDVLREIGKFFSVNQMIARDSVASRLSGREQGISYTEFSYMILQAYDFLHLNRAHRCTVQVGGSDQFGNIVSGIDLIRRLENTEAYGITNHLVTRSDGGKIGKTEKGAIWLDADRTSPYRFHQFWLNTSDADAGKFLRWFTFLERPEIESLEQSLVREPQLRAAQHALADHMTRIFHGTLEVERAKTAAKALFSGEVRALDARTLGDVASDLPSSEVPQGQLAGDGVALLDLLPSTTLAQSKREARDFLAAGAVTVNGEKAAPDARLRSSDLLHGSVALLRRGKKQWHAVRAAK